MQGTLVIWLGIVCKRQNLAVKREAKLASQVRFQPSFLGVAENITVKFAKSSSYWLILPVIILICQVLT